MVSQPERTLSLLPPPPPAHAQRPRAPQSVVSERIERPSYGTSRFLSDSSSSRREGRQHRATRSHTGSSSYQADNKYPEFKVSGNVEVVLSIGGEERRWLLHQHMLKQYSGWFEQRTSVAWDEPSNQQLTRPISDGRRRESSRNGRRESSRGPAPSPQRWRFELDQTPSQNHDIPMLIAVPPRPSHSPYDLGDSPPMVKNKPRISNSFFHSVANLAIGSETRRLPPPKPKLSKADEALIRDYDNLFRVFYNERLLLDKTSISNAFIQCDSLLELADAYDAVRCVRERINPHLMQFGSELFKDIAQHPAAYLRLSYLIRNEDVFKEALIHVVGRWPLDQSYLDGTILPDSILDMVEAKAAVLRRQVVEMENRLLKLTLINRYGQRVRHGMGMEGLAVELWRDWFTDSLYVPPPKPPSSRSSRPSVASQQEVRQTETQRQHKTLRRIGLGPDSYLTPEDIKQELKKTRELYTRENLERLRDKVKVMKLLAQETVQPLMRQDSRVTGHGYLLCTRVTDADYLWVNED